jgi:hypothetical protein
LQTEYAAWLDALPEPLRDGTTGEALQAATPPDSWRRKSPISANRHH